MKLLNSGDILETIEMLTTEHLDVRTVTMGISLLDCIDPDGRKACEKIYNKITARAARLVLRCAPRRKFLLAENSPSLLTVWGSVAIICLND